MVISNLSFNWALAFAWDWALNLAIGEEPGEDYNDDYNDDPGSKSPPANPPPINGDYKYTGQGWNKKITGHRPATPPPFVENRYWCGPRQRCPHRSLVLNDDPGSNSPPANPPPFNLSWQVLLLLLLLLRVRTIKVAGYVLQGDNVVLHELHELLSILYIIFGYETSESSSKLSISTCFV